MTRRFSGQTIRRYDEHADHSRRLLFARDRELRQLAGRLARAESTLRYLADLVSGKVGGCDAPWITEQAGVALAAYASGAGDGIPGREDVPWGIAELAAHYGVKRATIDQRRWRGVLTEAAGHVSGTPYWWRSTIVANDADATAGPREI